MSILHNLTLSKALDLLEKGEITAVNLTEHYLKKIILAECYGVWIFLFENVLCAMCMR